MMKVMGTAPAWTRWTSCREMFHPPPMEDPGEKVGELVRFVPIMNHSSDIWVEYDRGSHSIDMPIELIIVIDQKLLSI